MLIEFFTDKTFLNFDEEYNDIKKTKKGFMLSFSATYSEYIDGEYETKYMQCVKFFDDKQDAKKFADFIIENQGEFNKKKKIPGKLMTITGKITNIYDGKKGHSVNAVINKVTEYED